jgi:hypothetical protein
MLLPDSLGLSRHSARDENRALMTTRSPRTWCAAGAWADGVGLACCRRRKALRDGEGRNRTGDTTIFRDAPFGRLEARNSCKPLCLGSAVQRRDPRRYLGLSAGLGLGRRHEVLNPLLRRRRYPFASPARPAFSSAATITSAVTRGRVSSTGVGRRSRGRPLFKNGPLEVRDEVHPVVSGERPSTESRKDPVLQVAGML